MTQSIAAQTFESDGLKYTILDDKEWTVSLAGAVDANITNLDIPSTVPYYPGGNVAGKIDCTVVEIGTRAFYQCSSLTAVFLLQQGAFLFVLPVPKNKIRKELSEQFL